ncbi:MAG: transglutaminase family protein [Actinomycetota bacterium]
MGIHVGIEHHTSYRFDRAVEIHPHVLRLRPAPHCRTPIESYSLTVDPPGHFINWQQDPFGNHLARLVFPEPADHLSLTVDLVVDLTVINPFDFFIEESAETFPFAYEPQLAADLEPYRRINGPPGPLLSSFVEAAREAADGQGTVDYLVELNRRLYDAVEYSIRMEPGVQDPEETLGRAVGSCRDSGWLLVEALRHLGLAARFVSGYLVQLAPDALPGLGRAAVDGPQGPSSDFTDLHAWAEVYVPGAGWVGLDPTSGLLAGEGHIPLACTPHPVSAAPVTGATGRTEVTFSYRNDVQRVREDPRVTKPYSDAQWERIDELGREVDARLVADDVRLTMGGEPTFVAIDDPDGDEWNTAADGPAKRRLAADLVDRLHRRFGPGGLVQHGQGKWYPGEPLPRWQTAVVWRVDGRPLWRRPELLARSDEPGSATIDDGRRFLERLAVRFGLDADAVLAAREDPVEVAWQEARLPAGEPPVDDVTVAEADEIDQLDARAALLRRLEGESADPAGFVLPLHPHPDGDGWATARWHLRRAGLFLIAGDSPVGLRLPLDSLTWSEVPPTFERSAFAPLDELPEPSPDPTVGAAREVATSRIPPTALAVEVVDGHLRVFLPPLEHAEHAVELLAVIEAVAAEVDRPVVVEGYPVPRDPRLQTVVVTPDPGVVEVNLQPTATWPDLADVVDGLYADARLTGLGTEKFAIDGGHTGTGGGNHLTIGGSTPADSPLLRRPDLLPSMLTYWQHHPSLSYLFSGQFIGPTSQAPRVDEGRADTLYELEIALAELDRVGDRARPWMVDRLLRHLLVDLTGNTHRAEFCIDKLHSPDSERGRLGLLELRAFEMPPHPRMALVQALLVRALVARFWSSPYRGRLVRWGTDLYDRFLLPWFVRLDINDVVLDLAAEGIEFDVAWLEPFLEFRFPLIGELELDDTRIELRTAIEPWHVLGEEVGATGTARYVDSSVERLQLLVEGFNEARHLVTCNGVPVPLQPTGVPSVAVAGVRYKAWAPHSSLHPTIGVHDPLVFDLVDRWSERSVGGCTYRVSHPGGRAYDTRPVNAAEAEARRAARFFRHGHTPGRVDVARLDSRLATTADRDNRRTLDLRRFPEAREGR